MKSFLLVSSLVVVLLSIAAYRIHVALFPAIPCDQDPPIEYQGRTWNACNVFSLEYKEARKKFRTLAKSQGAAEIISLPVVEEQDLTTDIAIFPGTRPGAILHTSATHGVEGYVGSAIQLALLESMESISASDRPTLILVHAVNPYGMANYRRFNENSVDLNRNAIFDFVKFLKERDPNIAGYDDLRDFLSPAIAPTAWDFFVGFWLKAGPLLVKPGFVPVKRALTAGQYHHEKGLFYGGTQWERSIAQLMDFLKARDLLEELLVHIDVHSGLGKTGKDTLILDSPRGVDLEQTFPFAESIVTPATEDKKAMSGYELTRGVFAELISEMSANCLAMVQEFGTIPTILVGRALILENALFHHGDQSSRQQGRQWLQQAFYPQSTEWRASIVQRGVRLMLQAIDYSKTVPVKEKEAAIEEEPHQEEKASDSVS